MASDRLALEEPALAAIAGASVLGRVATGPRAGQRVLRLGADATAPVVTSACGFSAPGDLSDTDPRLGRLRNSGGTSATIALAPGSPAIDAGDAVACPATDQHGTARPQGAGCDIGAHESQP